MFCPKCSQPQVSDEIRFCSRCGFQLFAVSQILRNEEMAFYPGYSKPKLPLIKRQELRSGAKMIFLSVFLTIPSLIFAGVIDHGLPLLAPVIAFMLGVAQMMYYFFFGESLLPQKKQQTYEHNENSHQFNFQPMQHLPYSVVDSKPLNTNDFAQNYSVSGRPTNYMERH